MNAWQQDRLESLEDALRLMELKPRVRWTTADWLRYEELNRRANRPVFCKGA